MNFYTKYTCANLAAKLLLAATITSCALFDTKPKVPSTEELVVLHCKAKALAPFIDDDSAQLKMARTLIEMERTGDISIEETLRDFGLALIEIDLFKQAYYACEKK